jgi:hypothetical protein
MYKMRTVVKNLALLTDLKNGKRVAKSLFEIAAGECSDANRG